MGEHRAPYLHVIRSAASEGASDVAPDAVSDIALDEASRSEGAQQAGTVVTTRATGGEVSDQLHDARVDDEPSSVTPTPPAELSQPSQPSQPLAQAIMYAAMSWLALCMERVAVAVDIQPISDGLYEVSCHYDDERTSGILLRVRLQVEPGLVIRSAVELVRPE